MFEDDNRFQSFTTSTVLLVDTYFELIVYNNDEDKDLGVGKLGKYPRLQSGEMYINKGFASLINVCYLYNFKFY
jgi:hypothetical protein